MKRIIIGLWVIILATAVYFLLTRDETPPASVTPGPGEIGLELVAEGLVAPLALVSAEDGSGRLFVVDQIGLVKIIDQEGNLLANNFLDVRDKLVTIKESYDERGLLGLAFHPDFENNGRFFVYYSSPLRAGAPAGWDHTSVLAEYLVGAADPNVALASSEKIILKVDEPQFNHNAGHIAFGPDNYLYIPLGDGGQANDVALGHPVKGNGQDTNTLLGSILRIDVDSGSPYAIPTDNPFVGKAGADEIYAYGFRNPYHISFDKLTGQLFVADVGQNLWEEIDIVEQGQNYGWNLKEGKHCFDPESANESPATCTNVGFKGEALTDPIIEYGREFGVSNVGGYVYRGQAIEWLQGNYVFADWSRGFTGADGSVYAAALKDGAWSFSGLKIFGNPNGSLNLFARGIGQDEAGELYLLAGETAGPSGQTGKVFKITLP